MNDVQASYTAKVVVKSLTETGANHTATPAKTLIKQKLQGNPVKIQEIKKDPRPVKDSLWSQISNSLIKSVDCVAKQEQVQIKESNQPSTL